MQYFFVNDWGWIESKDTFHCFPLRRCFHWIDRYCARTLLCYDTTYMRWLAKNNRVFHVYKFIPLHAQRKCVAHWNVVSVLYIHVLCVLTHMLHGHRRKRRIERMVHTMQPVKMLKRQTYQPKRDDRKRQRDIQRNKREHDWK